MYSRFVKEYTDWDGLYQRIKDGSITDSDINTLSKLGILDKTNTSKPLKKAVLSQIRINGIKIITLLLILEINLKFPMGQKENY